GGRNGRAAGHASGRSVGRVRLQISVDDAEAAGENPETVMNRRILRVRGARAAEIRPVEDVDELAADIEIVLAVSLTDPEMSADIRILAGHPGPLEIFVEHRCGRTHRVSGAGLPRVRIQHLRAIRVEGAVIVEIHAARIQRLTRNPNILAL